MMMVMQRGRNRIAHAAALCMAVSWMTPRAVVHSFSSATSSLFPDFSPKKGTNKKLGGYLIDKIDPKATLALREKVMWPGRPELCPLPMDASGLHLGYFNAPTSISNGDPIGVISVFLEQDASHFRKFAVDQDFQGMGVGSLLLKATIEHVVQSSGIRVLWCDARIHQQAFYERFGFEKVGEPFAKYGGSGGEDDAKQNNNHEALYVRMELELTMSSGESCNDGVEWNASVVVRGHRVATFRRIVLLNLSIKRSSGIDWIS